MSEIKEAVNTKKFPEAFIESFDRENKLLSKLIFGDVLDIGCADSRILPFMVENIDSYTGVEIDKGIYKRAVKTCSKFKNAKVFLGDAVNFLKDTKRKYDWIIIAWGTLFCVDNPDVLLSLVSKNAENVYISLNAKGAAKERLQYYKNIGEEVSIDKEETISSSVWGEQRAFSLPELENIEKKLGFELIKRGRLGKYLIYGIYKK